MQTASPDGRSYAHTSISGVLTKADGTVVDLGVLTSSSEPVARPSFIQKIGARLWPARS